MQEFVEELKSTARGQASESLSSCFGKVVSQDNGRRMLKVVLEPFGIETGWLRVFQWPYLPWPHTSGSANGAPELHDHEEPFMSENDGPDHVHDITPVYKPYPHRQEFKDYNWVDKEVVVLMLYGDINSGVVLGPMW